MRKVANILLVIYVVICGLFAFKPVSSGSVYFQVLEALVICIALSTPGLFIYTIVRLLSIMDPVDELTIHKFAIILLAIYFVVCVLFTLFACAFNDSGEPVEKIILLFLLLLVPGLSIYTIIYLLYDTYKQFALWKIVNIVLLVLSTCLSLLFLAEL